MDTRLFSEDVKPGIPLGKRSFRSGRGPTFLLPNFLFNGIWRAREADPHGGAKKIPTTLSIRSQLIKSSSPSGVQRSAMTTADMTFFERSLSTPKLLFMPNWRSDAVTRAVPANTSMMRQSDKDAPLFASAATRFNRQGFFDFSWSKKLCGAWHPFFIHKCQPRLHSAPFAASWHLLRLKLKHMRRLWSSKPTQPLFWSSAGKMFATLLPLFLVFPRPFGLGLP